MLKAEEIEDEKVGRKSEVGIWPPAHRGIRLRPGGKAEMEPSPLEVGGKKGITVLFPQSTN